MKKILGFILSMFLLSAQAFAVVDTSLCPKPPYPVSSGLPLVLSNITGTNFLLTKVGELELQRQLKKELGADFNVEIYPYGGKNLIDGKFKRIMAAADNISIDGMSITSVRSESLCSYNHFVCKGNDVYAAENFLSRFDVIITASDLQRTFSSNQYCKTLSSMNMSFNNFTLFKVFDPVATIKNNRIDMSVKMISPLVHAGNVRNVSLNMGLEVQDGKIVFSDVKLNEKCANLNLSAILPILNRLNPFTYQTEILKAKGSVVSIKDIKIVNNSIHITGLVFIPKNYY